MSFFFNTPDVPTSHAEYHPHPELLFMQLHRDNLIAQSRRLNREIAELTQRIEVERSKVSPESAASDPRPARENFPGVLACDPAVQ